MHTFPKILLTLVKSGQK